MVSITVDGFVPEVVEIEVGQTVMWVNMRERIKALVLGVRGLSEMRSGFLGEMEIFSWTFDSPGEYTYVDGVVIGRVGKVVVE